MACNGRHGSDIQSTSLARPAHLSDNLQETVSTNASSSRFTHFVNSHQDPAYASLPEAERTRAKRKRTSPADHAFLEAEYQRNPKPDKAARTSIVQRVALNDKEVQIWFQNRRQVTRRKSRPLSPHEIYSSFRSSQGSARENSSSSFEPACLTSSQSNIPTTHPLVEGDSHSSHRNSSASGSGLEHGVQPASSGLNQVGGNADTERSSSLSDTTDPTPSLSKQTTNKEAGDEESTGDTAQEEVGVGMSTNVDARPASNVKRWSDFSQSSRTPKSLKRTASFRLSTSLDGKAQVVMGTGDTPSPPSKPLGPVTFPQRYGSLQRSKSAVDLNGQSSSSVADISSLWPRSSMPGRSSDVRTWEFYCDSDVRNALSVQAEQEKKGSALGLLGLIRSSSASSKIPSTPLNQHISQLKHGPGKRKGAGGRSDQRPKISRTTSSVARLQTVDVNVQRHTPKTLEGDPKQDLKNSRHRDPSGDSDKENWEPGTQLRNSQRRTAGGQRGVLTETTRTACHSMRLENLLNQDAGNPRRRPGKYTDGTQDKENIGIDPEVSRFMGEANPPRQEDDLDCVQNLLSLSQGQWQ